MEIVLAVGIVAAIGLISGLGLSFASSVMAVPTDETTENVRALLPGANCGACGYTGCDSYAQALSAGQATANLCSPGGADTAKSLSELLGVESGEVNVMKAKVLCNGSHAHTDVKMKYSGMSSCAAANLMYSGTSACNYGCLGFGDCVGVCEYDAISVNNGVAVVDDEKCTGCLLCVKACPKSIIDMLPEQTKIFVRCSSKDKGGVTRKVCEVGCIGCMRCVKACNYDAIAVKDSLALIDQEKCTACGECAKVCPTNCIETVNNRV